jgi:GntR family transcriptional regulator/MocR family aminotransferase
MRSLYIRRQNELSRVFENELGPLLETHVLNAGLHLLGYLQDGQDDRIVANKARRLGLFPRPLSDYTIDAKLRSGLLIGFSNMSEDSMPRASRVLRRAILESRNA